MYHADRPSCEISVTIHCSSNLRDKWPICIKSPDGSVGEVYLEPGEAIGWQTGYLMASVLDIVDNKMNIAILDTSAEAHMPDTLAMPYKADIRDFSSLLDLEYKYRFAGNTCLAGDIIGDYSSSKELKIGDKIILEDMIHYTMVKTTTFNGIKLPSLAIKKGDCYHLVTNYGYDEYKRRLS